MFSDDYGDDVPEWAVGKQNQIQQFRTPAGGWNIPDKWIEGNPYQVQGRSSWRWGEWILALAAPSMLLLAYILR
jgi:hypothetical protein